MRCRETISAIPPYCALWGFGVSTWPSGCDTPSPFLSVSPLESMRSGGAIPPPSKGVSQRYLRDTLGKQGKWVRYPLCDTYLERVLRDMGGISHWAAKFTSVGERRGENLKFQGHRVGAGKNWKRTHKQYKFQRKDLTKDPWPVDHKTPPRGIYPTDVVNKADKSLVQGLNWPSAKRTVISAS